MKFLFSDYFAPLSESGEYTEKYNITEELVAKYQPVKFRKPSRPVVETKVVYPTAVIEDYLNMDDILAAAVSSVFNYFPVILHWLLLKFVRYKFL